MTSDATWDFRFVKVFIAVGVWSLNQFSSR